MRVHGEPSVDPLYHAMGMGTQPPPHCQLSSWHWPFNAFPAKLIECLPRRQGAACVGAHDAPSVNPLYHEYDSASSWPSTALPANFPVLHLYEGVLTLSY